MNLRLLPALVVLVFMGICVLAARAAKDALEADIDRDVHP